MLLRACAALANELRWAMHSELMNNMEARDRHRTLLMRDLWMWGMTPPPAMVACERDSVAVVQAA